MITVVIYRNMTPSDSMAVFALMNRNLDRPTPIDVIEYFITIWPEGQFVAEDLFGNIVGALCSTEMANGEASISLLAVDAKHRGQGIGTRLLSEFRNKCFLTGLTSVLLELRVTNTFAYNFYIKHGFKLTEKVPNLYGPGEDGYRMIAMVSEINHVSS